GVAIIRGLRAVSDFEYEFQMAHTNKKLAPNVETVFIAADNRYTFISSNVIKEVSSLGGDVSDLVPNCVLKELTEE
ncbi:MAG: pantetheine-phosphate adenylyltransferase, partial [Candidatus Muiribacteriota bacterium]